MSLEDGPPIENGYTKFANELLEALIRFRIPGEQMQCLLLIIRKTYGYHKTQDAISLSQFAWNTGIKKQNICRALKELEKKNLIVIKKDNRFAKTYRINGNYQTWKSLSKKVTLSKKITRVIKTDNQSLSKMSTTKEIYTKETGTKKRDPFDPIDIFGQ